MDKVIKILDTYANNPINFIPIHDIIHIKDIELYKERLLKYYKSISPSNYNRSILIFIGSLGLPSTTESFIKCFDLWFFYQLSSNPNLTSKIIEKYFDYWDYTDLLSNKSLSSKLIRKYFLDKDLSIIDIRHMLSNPNFAEDMLEEYTDKILQNIPDCTHINNIVCNKCMNDKITKYFLILANATNLTPKLIEKYEDRLNFNSFDNYDKFTPRLIRKYIDKLDFEILSRCINLTPELIEEYIDDLNGYDLASNPNLSIELIEKYSDYLNDDGLCFNPNITLDIVKKYNLDLFDISDSSVLTKDLIEKHFDELNDDELLHNPNLTLDMIEKYYSTRRFNSFTKQMLVPEFILKHKNKLNIRDIYEYYDEIYNIYYKQKYNKTMIELSYCPYDKYNSNKIHHYHQGYDYLKSLEDTMNLYN